MARYPKDDIRSGGFVKLWPKALLADDKLGELTLEEQGVFMRVLMAAQLIQWTTGAFEVADIPLSVEQIALKATGASVEGIKPEHIAKLIEKGLLVKNGSNSYKFRNWEKWQLNSNSIEIKSLFNSTGIAEKTLKAERLTSDICQPPASQPSSSSLPTKDNGGGNKRLIQKKVAQIEDFHNTLNKPNLSDKHRDGIKKRILALENEIEQLKAVNHG